MPEWSGLRLARSEDLPALSRLATWVWLQTYADRGVRPAFVDYLQTTFDPAAHEAWLGEEGRCWLVEEGGHLQGFLRVRLGSPCPCPLPTDPARDTGATETVDAEICQLYVAPPLARSGLGRRLLAHAREQLASRALWLSVWALNERAIAFYEAQRGRRLGETWFELEQQRHPNWIYAWPPLRPASGSLP